jgi:23S rRNA (uracil1939-C5)-methyltransferase
LPVAGGAAGIDMIGVVQAVAKGGCGIVRDGERTVFVPGTIGGETIEFALAGRERGVWNGELLRVLEPSPQRVPAPCPHYGDCGGCNLQHMDYQEQLRCKAGILAANLRKIAGVVRSEPVPALPSPPWRYRSRTELQAGAAGAGYFRKKSRQTVAVRRCLLLSEAAERFVGEFPARPPGGEGVLEILDNGHALAARLRTRAGAVHWLTPERALDFDLSPLRYRCGPEHFIQANRFLLRPMLDELERILPPRADSAADLFCGGGFFTLALARRCRLVHAMENDPANLAALRANIEGNGAGNVEVQALDARRAALPDCELFVLDPPRAGLSPALIDRVVRSRAQRIVYFSCDSATFARDLALFLRAGFALRDVRIIDNFPQTDHFEIFSLLEK